ncbi:MAG: hypothetical protein RBS99_03155 [Rhodospirillales bacterium]|nr:hypothetical protein [Rhodospirillales bacterium]
MNIIGRHGLIASVTAILLLGCVGETGTEPVGGTMPAGRWTVTDSSGGQLTWRDGVGDWRTLTVGTELGAAAEIRSGADSAAVLARGGDTITVAENSQMSLPAAATASGVTRVKQSGGSSPIRRRK